MKLTAPPGVFDIIPYDSQDSWKSSYLWSYIEGVIRKTAAEYGFEEIRTPIFERTELFARGVGETSDIVSKEMYTFEDRGNRMMSLRPEGTAPAMRAFIEGGLPQASKLFYIGPMFRYERAQAGRYRQHHQFGVEAIGNSSPQQDVEVIDLLYTLYTRLGINNITLYLNSIGDVEARKTFRDALLDYLRPHVASLSADSQNRFHTNPLRILDSKDPHDQAIVAKAPSILDFLSDESFEHFEEVKRLLSALNIPYKVNHLLVRGLDYYNKTVFEVVAGNLGAQNSIGGGGRYDGLIKELGGPDLPAFGFGTGLERILQTMINQSLPLPRRPGPTLYLIPMGEQAAHACFKLLHDLRQKGILSQMDFSNKKVGKAIQAADQLGATYVAVVGEDELASNEITLKKLVDGTTAKVSMSQLVEKLT